ncbi:hypothetical protein M422DRAFT_146957, partial [Sphaerobolus stellatus SS14]
VDSIQTGRGRLTREEHERRMKEGLCLYCGTAGHVIRSCPKIPPDRRQPQVSAIMDETQDPQAPQAGNFHTTAFNKSLFFLSILLRFPGKKPITTHALVDCGASGCFISDHFAQRHSLPWSCLPDPVPIYAVDGHEWKTAFRTHLRLFKYT